MLEDVWGEVVGCGKGKLLEEVAFEQSFRDFLETRDVRLGVSDFNPHHILQINCL